MYLYEYGMKQEFRTLYYRVLKKKTKNKFVIYRHNIFLTQLLFLAELNFIYIKKEREPLDKTSLSTLINVSLKHGFSH